MYWRAESFDADETMWIHRFDPRFFTLNFPAPMVAAAIDDAPDGLRIEALFYKSDDLAGVIWTSEDTIDHPLLRYATDRDYRGVIWSFRWQSSGAKPLDALWGPTLTIEGRDALGNPRAWYVRLWNYAVGTAEDAFVTLDFDALDGGFLLPIEADPVYAGDIDRMFLSLVPPAFDGVATGPLAAPAAATVTMSGIKVSGSRAPLRLGDHYVKPHRFRAANGYDDCYHLTPGRVLRNLAHLGYRDTFIHYVGMSHYFRLGYDAGEGRFVVQASTPLNAAATAWHESLFARCGAFGLVPRISVSFELLAAYAPAAWAQRTGAGDMAETGWSPPSTLLSPCNGAAMDYLLDVFLAFVALLPAGTPVRAQIGEPWWWFQRDGVGTPCLYDAATMAAWTAETGLAVPTVLTAANATPSTEQSAYLDWLKEQLGAATLALRDGIKAACADADVALLIFPPELFDASGPLRARVNYPVGAWKYPAFDRLEVEDYDYLIFGDQAAHAAGLKQIATELEYGPARSDYFAGFVLNAEDAGLWRPIMAAADEARVAGYQDVVIWALPQILRDGIVAFDQEMEEDMSGFHEVRFPAALSFGASGGPRFSTTVVETASGFERRNVNWAEARGEYDVGLGLRAEGDLVTVLGFFRARAGRAYGFRFKDWLDCQSASTITPFDQIIATGDGVTAAFPLVKIYDDGGGSPVARRIFKPVEGSVRVGLGGAEVLAGFAVDTVNGRVIFDVAPAPGAAVTAGFAFDVPVRFAADQLSVSLETFRAGAIPSIPLAEIKCREPEAP